MSLALGFGIAGCTAAVTYLHPEGSAPGDTAALPPRHPAPPERIGFDHAGHLERGVACLDCHEDADKSEKAAMPKVEFCLGCHEEIDASKPKDKTVEAFLEKPGGEPRWSRVTAQPDDVRFSHAAHAGKGVACKECHAGIEKSKAVGPELALDMEGCMECHEQRAAPNDCATCHRVAAEGVAAGKGPWWRPANHDANWKRVHGAVARRGAPTRPAEKCETCHDAPDFPAEAGCAACHAATRPADHARMWKVLHGKTVRRDSSVLDTRCIVCHERSACINCHKSEPPKDHTRAWCTGGGHGLASSADRTRCEACHRPDACASCHQHTPPRSHQAGWGAPRDRHCYSCHIPLRGSQQTGCAVCHKGTPSHASAPPMPNSPQHTPDAQCLLCHGATLRHADNGTSCVVCHK